MDKRDIIPLFLLTLIVCSVFIYVHRQHTHRLNEQAKIIEKLQGDVRTLETAFQGVEIAILKQAHAYGNWNKTISELGKAKDNVRPIPRPKRSKKRKTKRK